jgi:RNA polymerase sigma-70 factor (ECF subfamily)
MSIAGENNIFKNQHDFEKLFKEKYRPLCLLACKYVKDIETAEEIVQEIFVKLWEKNNQLVVNGSIIAYISTSVKNSCLNYLKHKAIVATYEKSEAVRFAFDNSENEEEMYDLELETAIIKAIDELPPQRKKIFMFSRVDGLKYHEIAEKMDLSIKTIEAQMGQALKQLRVKLKEFI